MVDALISHYNYWLIIILMMLGLYVVVSRGNLVKKIVGLNIFQTSNKYNLSKLIIHLRVNYSLITLKNIFSE